ncbi:MAG: transglycosylase SLT domain-containing protein [Chloroflexota bacterium]
MGTWCVNDRLDPILSKFNARLLYIIFSYLALSLALGCDNSTPTPTPIPSGTSLAIIAETPDSENEELSTALHGSAPTATPQPNDRLTQATQLFRYGDYAATRSLLAPIRRGLEQDDPLFAPSQILLAQAYMEEGLHEEALIVLQPLLPLTDLAVLDPELAEKEASSSPAVTTSEDTDPESTDSTGNVLYRDASPTAAKIEMLYAEALRGASRSLEALTIFQKFVEKYPWSTQLVQTKIGNLLLNLGRSDEAIDAYNQAATVTSHPSTKVGLLETVATLELRAGRPENAVAAYEAILAVAQRPAYRTAILFQAGQAATTADDEELAIAYWLAATEESPENGNAYQALIQLVNRDVEFDLYQRGYIDLKSEAWIPAINAFQAYLDSVLPSDERAGLAMLGMAQAYTGAGNYAAALETADALLASYPDCSCIGQTWLEKALAQAWLGQSVASHRTYRTFAREVPNDPLAGEALWQSGMMAYREGSPIEAAIDLLSLVEAFPKSERAPLALYLLGLGAFREGLWAQSATFFERMLTDYPDEDRAAAAYWLGRAYYAQASPSSRAEFNEALTAAEEQWAAAVEASPGDYYSVLAAIALRQDPPNFQNLIVDLVKVESEPTTLSGDDGSRAFAERWLQDWIISDHGQDGNVEDPEDSSLPSLSPFALGSLPTEIQVHPDFVQGQFFLSLNQRAEAQSLLEHLMNLYERNPKVLYGLSLAYEKMGAYRLSLIAANSLLLLSPANNLEDAPIFLQRLVHPRRFAELVDREAAKHNIDPLLFYSLIRQESLFEEGARSYAAAQGLAQIIPDTGAWVADRVGYINYRNELVYRPHINLWFGAFYLDWVRGYLDENLISALVGYNAGPGNSENWRKESGPDDPLFVEILTFSEPRLYVHKIMSNYYHYLRLYR